MKKLTFQKNTKPKKGFKSISITQEIDEKESLTKVTKGFEYQVKKTASIDLKQEAPDIKILKSCDSKKQTETFRFDVKGVFYHVEDRMIYKVHFHHHLNIEINWKIKIFSPKKSVVLTK